MFGRDWMAYDYIEVIMTTTREKRMRRAERMREWADAREAKQTDLNEAARSDEAATGIPFGQPILIGHHSEQRHRRAIERIDRAMVASVENSCKAESMHSRAENIEAQAAQAIYTDDEDADKRLTEKIAALEVERDAMKAANAAFRKEHAASLKGRSAYEKNCVMPHPSYSITNMTANIGRLKKRLAGLDATRARQATDRTIISRYGGTCEDCGATFERGQLIRYSKANGARCAEPCLPNGATQAKSNRR